jgi:hypothetical protein
LYNSIIAGKTEIPFQLLQSPGGADLMRGFRYGQYRDNWLILAQAEYRLSVYKRLKAALFVNTGDVIHIKNIQYLYDIYLFFKIKDYHLLNER